MFQIQNESVHKRLKHPFFANKSIKRGLEMQISMGKKGRSYSKSPELQLHYNLHGYLDTKVGHGLLYIWTEQLSIFLAVHMRLKFGTKITPKGWIFLTMIFFKLKKFTSSSI